MRYHLKPGEDVTDDDVDELELELQRAVDAIVRRLELEADRQFVGGRAVGEAVYLATDAEGRLFVVSPSKP